MNLTHKNNLDVTHRPNSTSNTSEIVRNSIQNKIHNLQFMDERAKNLASYFYSQKFLSSKNNYFRQEQEGGFRNLIRNLNNAGNGGMVKLPTGAGKTFFFGNVIKALDCPSIILVPRENLVDGTYDELVGNQKKPGLGFEPENVERIYGKQKGNTKQQAEAILSKGEFNSTLIITYQSFVKLCETQPELFHNLTKNIGCIISDEAHRALGEKTTQTIDEAKSIASQETDEYEDSFDEENEIKAEELIDAITKKSDLVHLHMTATPNLSNKQVEEEIIHSVTFGESVTNGNLILPKQLALGTAQTDVYGDTITADENKKGLDKFYFEDGTPVYEELTLQYMDQKEKNAGYLPTVAFCNTTEQVEFYVQYLLSEGIKAIQCTTNSSGTNYCDIVEAEKKLESGEADIIVTCSKVGEGWDLPTLRGAMWLVPSTSPARVMQGTGRITRILKEEDILRLMKITGLPREIIEKNHNNTLIFSPNKWEYQAVDYDEFNDENQDLLYDEPKDKSKSSGSSKKGEKLGQVLTGIELYALYGELTLEQAAQLGLDMQGLKMRLSKEELFKELWNYKAMSAQESYNHFMSLGSKEIDILDIGGNKITSLKNILGIEIQGDIKTIGVFQEWIQKVFEGKDIQVNEEKFLIEFWNYEGRSTQESYNHFMTLGQSGIKELKILGQNIVTIRKLLPIKITGKIEKINVFQNYINEIFKGKNVLSIKQQILNDFWYYNGKSIQESYDYFKSLDKTKLNGIIIFGTNDLGQIRKKLGLARKGSLNLLTIFHQFIDDVFEGTNINKTEAIVTLNEDKIAIINGERYTPLSEAMKKDQYPHLPDNGLNLRRKIKKLPSKEQSQIISQGVKARIGTALVTLYNLDIIEKKFVKKKNT